MASEDPAVLLAKIGQLAGKINRHKNQQDIDNNSQSSSYTRSNAYGGYQQSNTAWQPGRGGFSSRGYSKSGRAPPVHRNRTLVLNGNRPTPGTDERGANEGENANGNSTATAWVTKQDRHLQLINPAVFEKENQKRAKALEQSRQRKLKHRDERESARFMKYLQRSGGNGYNGTVTRSTGMSGNHEVEVHGIRFRVTHGGSKLVKVPGDLNAAKSTPKSALIGGVRFHRSKSGNLYRAGIIKAHRRTGVVMKINEPCKNFTTTGTCLKGPRCSYIHDPAKVAVCKEFLQKGTCPSGEHCDLSHELTPERTPNCLHFAKGNCSNSNCRYSHVRVSPTAPVCRAFGVYGYCEKGASCTDRHVNECPDFSNTGTCTTKGCKLLHRHKASVMRNSTSRNDEQPTEGSSDISSDDEEEEIGIDDVDSDDLDGEYFGDDGKFDDEIPMQQDYVQLS